MAFETIVGGLFYGGMPAISGNNLTTANSQLNASTHRVAMVIVVPKTGTLDKFEFRLGTVTAIGGGSVLRASFQNVDSSGQPDGTQDQYRDISTGISSGAWVAPGLMTNNGTDGGSKRSVTVGDILACVVEYQTFTTGDNINLAYLSNSNSSNAWSEVKAQYAIRYGGASWAKITNGWAILALKYNDGTYEMVSPQVFPFSGSGDTSMDTGTTPDEGGLIFQVPFTCKFRAFSGRIWCEAAASAFDIVLYDDDGTTVLSSISLLGAYLNPVNTVANAYVPMPEVTLDPDVNYRLVIKPTNTTNTSVSYLDVNAAAILDALPGGQLFHWTQRTDVGLWSQTTTRRPLINPVLSAIDVTPGGGGGGSRAAYVG